MKPILRTLFKVSIPLLLSIAFVSLFVGQALATEKASKITFAKTTHDFGKVKQGVDLMFAFKFVNEGDENLSIKKVQASCGCTGAAIGDKKEFKKSEAGEIIVTFKTAGRSGVQSKTVTVQSNDPEHPTVVLSFTCEIFVNDENIKENK
jgi:hypothetical protein